MIRRPPRSTLFPYTTPLPIWRGKLLARIALADGFRRGREDRPRLHFRLRGSRYSLPADLAPVRPAGRADRKSTRLNSSHANISYAVFCLKKNKPKTFPPALLP